MRTSVAKWRKTSALSAASSTRSARSASYSSIPRRASKTRANGTPSIAFPGPFPLQSTGMSSQVVPLQQAGPAASRLESGDVLWHRHGMFTVDDRESPLFTPDVLAGGKNVSFDPASGQLG